LSGQLQRFVAASCCLDQFFSKTFLAATQHMQQQVVRAQT